MCSLFIFRHPLFVASIVFARDEVDAWHALADKRYPYARDKALAVETVKHEFTLMAELKLPRKLKEA